MRVAGVVALTLLGSGCEDEPKPDPEPPISFQLTASEGWTLITEPANDPFADRPETIECDADTGALAEWFGPDPVFEIDTDRCPYATAEHPALAALQAGDVVNLRVWHEALLAEEPTEAHLALALDGIVAWETRVPIPSAAAIVEAEVIVDRDLPAATPLQWHVHNHGDNTYDLFDIAVTRTPQ